MHSMMVHGVRDGHSHMQAGKQISLNQCSLGNAVSAGSPRSGLAVGPSTRGTLSRKTCKTVGKQRLWIGFEILEFLKPPICPPRFSALPQKGSLRNHEIPREITFLRDSYGALWGQLGTRKTIITKMFDV